MPASNRRSLLRSSALAGAGQQTMSFSFSHAQSRRRFLAGPGSAVVCFPLVSRASHAAADVTARVTVATPVAVGAGHGGNTHDHGNDHDHDHDDGVRASVHALRRHDGATTVA